MLRLTDIIAVHGERKLKKFGKISKYFQHHQLKNKKTRGIYMKFFKKCILFICITAISLATASCATSISRKMHEDIKDKYESRAFKVGENSGIFAYSDKHVNYKQGCNFNFADLIARIVHEKIMSEGIKVEPVMPVGSIHLITEEWKQHGKELRTGFGIYFIGFHCNDNNCRISYSVFKIKSNHFSKKHPISFNPDNYTDTAVCYADFENILRPIVDEFYQEVLKNTPKEKL